MTSYDDGLRGLAHLTPARELPRVPRAVSPALARVEPSPGGARVGQLSPSSVWPVISLASSLASAYHGVRRNRGSVGWGLGWGLLGALFPIVTPVIAVAQGYAQPLPPNEV